MARRSALASEVVALIGPAATLVDEGSGWPSMIDLDLGEGRTTRLAAHLGPVHSMARKGKVSLARRPDELRFQNPGPGRSPEARRGALSLLVGILPSIDDDPPALIVPDNHRVGLKTRFSVRFPGALAYEGARSGWATHVATDGERFWALSPRLLPALVVMLEEGVEAPARQVRTAVQAVGALADDDGATKERARVATTRLARAAAFRPRVIGAYGESCVLCGMSVAVLLEAAHILPASLPGSLDVASNGIPVCLHHHALLDEHLLHISPSNLAVTISPRLREMTEDPAILNLVATTKETFEIPIGVDSEDVMAWLAKRHAAFSERYGWVSSARKKGDS